MKENASLGNDFFCTRDSLGALTILLTNSRLICDAQMYFLSRFLYMKCDRAQTLQAKSSMDAREPVIRKGKLVAAVAKLFARLRQDQRVPPPA